MNAGPNCSVLVLAPMLASCVTLESYLTSLGCSCHTFLMCNMRIIIVGNS